MTQSERQWVLFDAKTCVCVECRLFNPHGWKETDNNHNFNNNNNNNNNTCISNAPNPSMTIHV